MAHDVANGPAPSLLGAAEVLECGDSLHVVLSRVDAVMIVSPCGDLDPHHTQELAAALERAVAGAPAALVIDASLVGCCSARALAMVVATCQHALSHGTDVALAGLAPVHRRLLEECWPDADYGRRCHDSLAEALAAVEAAHGLRWSHSELLAEVVGMRRAMATRSTIEQAKGVLMAQMHCTPERAFEVLVGASQRSNRKLRHVAESLIVSALRH